MRAVLPALALSGLLLAPTAARAQSKPAATATHATHAAHAGPSSGAAPSASRANSAADEKLIANALSAAPLSIAKTASVMNHDGRMLKKGSSDWVCMPDMPDVPNNTPMCLDAPWRSFIDAWMKQQKPTVTAVGFGYMMQGDMPVSNTDPFAKAPTTTNEWIANGVPHVMLLLPDPKQLQSISGDANNGGPWVMWRGTAWAHVMVPTTTSATRTEKR